MTLLKDIYTEDFLRDFGQDVLSLQEDFPVADFITEVLAGDWDDLTLRPRMQKIAMTLGTFLKGSYAEQLPLILNLHQNNRGFNYLFLPDFIAIYGQAETDFDLSLSYLKALTPFSSSEFAIRPFINTDHQRVLPLLNLWSLDPDPDVRRLASEGLRPRLPWGVHLTALIAEPELSLPILTNLRQDPSLYVRKSVANHLNDHAKDHPDFVLTTCESWQNLSLETDWIIKRACRTLLKKGNPRALALFGYGKIGTTFEVSDVSLKTSDASLAIGESMTFNYGIKTTINTPMPVKLEYGIDYFKANGKHALKKFHLADGLVNKKNLAGTKSLTFKNLSTRKHYPGTHHLYLFLNGDVIATTSFTLT